MDENSVGAKRRGRRKASFGGSSLSDSTVTHGGYIGDHDLNQEVTNRVIAAPHVTEEEPSLESEQLQNPTHRNGIPESHKRASSYEKEYRLKLVHRMLMRNVPLGQMAKELDISIKTVQRDRTELLKRLRVAAQELDLNEMIGDTLGFYGEIQGMSLRTASVSKLPVNMKLAAMRTALASKNDQHRFLNAAGVFDVLKYKATEKGEADDLEKLVSITKAILDGESIEDNLQSFANESSELEDEERVHVI